MIDKYVNFGTPVPEGSFFYNEQVVEKKELNDSAFDDIPDGYTVFLLPVTAESTYANSIFPGDYIDLYMKGTSEDGLLIFGRLIKQIEVLAVRDNAGKNVFANKVASLDAVSPLKSLSRGFAAVKNSKGAVKSVKEVAKGETINLTFCDGSANCTVDSVTEE